MEIHVVGPAWGLPTADPACLAVLTYCRFRKVPASHIHMDRLTLNQPARHPFLLEQPEDPSPAAGDGQQNTDRGIRPPLATPFSIVARLRAMGYNVDHGLSPRQAGDSVAFASLVEDALAPALEATLWLNEDTYGSVTRRAYDGLFRFPFQFFLPKGIKARCAAVVAGKSEAKLLADADRAMQALSIRLGQAPFFFGDSPTYLDALVFGYLGVLKAALPPRHRLVELLNQYHNLSEWCSKLRTAFFGEEERAYLAAEKDKSLDKVIASKAWRGNIPYIAGATCLMGAYLLVLLRLNRRI